MTTQRIGGSSWIVTHEHRRGIINWPHTRDEPYAAYLQTWYDKPVAPPHTLIGYYRTLDAAVEAIETCAPPLP